MIRNMHTPDDTRHKRRGLRLAKVAALAVVAGGIVVPASAAVAAPMPDSSAVNLFDSHSMHAPNLPSDNSECVQDGLLKNGLMGWTCNPGDDTATVVDPNGLNPNTGTGLDTEG
ncbi:hypothetical protein [Streptomyces sp. NBC_00271]|uniref:hypothetical protein n=1 Tax=Streptomyces sp. NBC_00271 TaxID=2975697 RepID=UPI002E2D001B|nr:hypothetical protein [Streptomyces sp. NBC_00271]